MQIRHITLALAAVLLAACTTPVSGQPQSGNVFATESVKPPVPTTPSLSGSGRTYTTIQPTTGELPPHPNSHLACDLMSWDAFDRRVRPQPLTPPYIWPVNQDRDGSMECRLVNENLADKAKVVIVSVVIWKKMAMLPHKTDDIGGFEASISERKSDDHCTIIVDQKGRSRVGFAVTNNWFTEPGLEPCTLTRQAADWVFPSR